MKNSAYSHGTRYYWQLCGPLRTQNRTVLNLEIPRNYINVFVFKFNFERTKSSACYSFHSMNAHHRSLRRVLVKNKLSEQPRKLLAFLLILCLRAHFMISCHNQIRWSYARAYRCKLATMLYGDDVANFAHWTW